MTDETRDNIISRLENASKAVEERLDIIDSYFAKVLDPIADFIQRAFNLVESALFNLGKQILKYYKQARYITIPFHWLWIWLWQYFYSNKDLKEPTNEVGVHYVSALAGQGKSTFLWQKMNDYAKMTGKCSYVTTAMEKLKYDDDGNAYVHHIQFRPEDFFGPIGDESKLGYQKKRFNNDLACAIVYDEMHVLNNNRLNSTRENKQVFIPMISSFVMQRHFGFNWILIASQQPRNDNQIMNILVGYHQVRIKKGFVYKDWLKDGLFTRRIKGWSVKTFNVKATESSLQLVSRKRWFKKATVSFDDFESLNMKNALDHLPVDRKAVL